MPLLAPDKAIKGTKDPNEVYEADPVRVYKMNKEAKQWVDMVRPSLFPPTHPPTHPPTLCVCTR